MQLFNYGGYISTGVNTGAANPIPASDITPAADGTQCLTSRAGGTARSADRASPATAAGTASTRCSRSCSARASTSIELFGHAGLPANERDRRATRLEGLPRAARQVRPARRGLARQHRTRPPGTSASPRPRSSAPTTSARAASPTRASAPTTTCCAAPRPSTASASTRSRPASARSTSTTTPVSSTRKYVDNGVLKTAWRHPHGAHRPALRRGRARRLLVLGRVQRRHRRGDRRASSTKYPTRMKHAAHQGRHQHRRRSRSPTNSRGGSPRALGTGELDFRPIFAAGQGQGRSTTTRSRTAARSPTPTSSLTNLKGVGTAVVGTVLACPPSSRRSPPAPPRRQQRRRHDQEHR